MEFKKLRDMSFKNNLLKGKAIIVNTNFKESFTKLITDENSNTIVSTEAPKYGDSPPNFKLRFNPATKINCIVLQEEIVKGQKISKLEIVLIRNNTGIKNIQLTTIGRKRIITFPSEYVDEVFLYIKESKGKPAICEVAAYLVDEKLVEK